MQSPFAPRLGIGELSFLGSFWFQLTQDREARVKMEPSPNFIIIRLDDFSGEGPAEAKIERRAKDEIVLSLHRTKGTPEFGTSAPQRFANIGEKEIWFSFIVNPFLDTALVWLALYSKDKVQGEDGKGPEQAK
jgi:hypothetical protein